MTIWEEYGISLDDYAKAFNKMQDEEWEKLTKDKVYLVNLVDGYEHARRIYNVEFPDMELTS